MAITVNEKLSFRIANLNFTLSHFLKNSWILHFIKVECYRTTTNLFHYFNIYYLAEVNLYWMWTMYTYFSLSLNLLTLNILCFYVLYTYSPPLTLKVSLIYSLLQFRTWDNITVKSYSHYALHIYLYICGETLAMLVL